MIKRFVSLILVLFLSLAAFPAGGLDTFALFGTDNAETDAFSRYILTFREDADMFSLLEGYTYRVISATERVCIVTADDVSLLSPYCVYAEKEASRRVLELSLEESRWESVYCSFEESRVLSGNGAGVTVAVLDTGVDRTHSELKNAHILDGYDAVTGKNGVYSDTDGHGTAVISLLAADDDGIGITGVAPGITVYPVKVATAGGTIYSSELIAGIYNAADNGADIINISLGGYSYSVSEQRAIDYAVSKGCIIIAAAGNDGADSALAGKYFYPASYDGVISVASVDPDGDISRFSQYNDKVDIAAPGRDITVCGTDGGYRTDSGTSFSSAIVSGIAALCFVSAGGLNCNEFEAVLISALGADKTSYSGYGVINGATAVTAAKKPVVTGIYNGAVLNTPAVITFNKGTATLDGKPFYSGDTVSEEGVHRFVLTYNKTVKTTVFYIHTKKPSYSVGENCINYSGGNGYLDGMPYESGAYIEDGVHTFLIKNEYYSESVQVNIGAAAFLGGVSDGKTYSDCVAVTGYGDGVFYINGTPFSGVKILGNGDYTAVATDKNGAVVQTVGFTVSVSVIPFDGFRYDTHIFYDTRYGYLAVSGGLVGNVRIYKLTDMNSAVRTVNVPGIVQGFDSDEENLYILLENGVYSIERADVSGAGIPKVSVKDGYIPYGGYSFSGNELYLNGNRVLTTPYGNIISLADGYAYTSQGVVDISNGRLVYRFFDELVSITDYCALFKNEGLILFADIRDIAVPADTGITENGVIFNEYTSFSCLSAVPEQIAYDGSSGKIYMLCCGTVYYTDISFTVSGALPFTDIPLYISAGGGKLNVFFETGYCTVDSNTLNTVYHSALSVPDKAVTGYYGTAAFRGETLVLTDGTDIVYINDISISDIAVSGNTVFVANSQGIGMFGFDGTYLGSIDAGDTAQVFTDGVYIASRDTVYLVSTGEAVGRIPAGIVSVMNGLIFAADGVYSPYGDKLSALVYSGVFDSGRCVYYSGNSITVHGGNNAGKVPNITGADGVYDISTDITADTGVLFVDGVHFSGGHFSSGGTHILECAMPFGIIYETEFSVVPALGGIAVSGGDREMNLGDSAYLLVEYLPYGASAVKAEFSVSGDSVVIGENGLLTAVNEGVSTVTVSAGGFTVTVKITVTRLDIIFNDPNIVYNQLSRVCFVPVGTTAEYLNSVTASQGEYHRIVGTDGADIPGDSFVGTGNIIRYISDTGELLAGVNIVVRGDTDGDGMLSAADLLLVQKGINGENIGLFKSFAADFDSDGSITHEDALLLTKTITIFNTLYPSFYGNTVVTASVPEILHPVSEFAVVLYADNGRGIDSVSGTLEYDSEVFELLYVTGINYRMESVVNDGVITFAAYDENGTPSERKVKTFGTVRFRVKEEVPLEEVLFKLSCCAVTVGGKVQLSEEVIKTSVIQRRTASDFKIEIPNAEYFSFNPTVRNYYITVPYDAVSPDIILDYPDGGIVYCSDTVIPESDELTVSIRYTSPSGVSTEYKIFVTRAGEPSLSSDAYLSSLSATVGEMLPQFVPERLSYKLNIPYSSPDPEFSCIPRDENTVVTAELPESFPVGSTDVVFVCTAQDGTEIKYTVTVIRAPQPVVSEPSEDSLPVDEPHSGTALIIATAVITAAAALAVLIIIYRKRKNNVKKIK